MRYMDIQYGIDNPLFLDPKEDREYFIKEVFPWMFKYALTVAQDHGLNKPVVRSTCVNSPTTSPSSISSPSISSPKPRLLSPSATSNSTRITTIPNPAPARFPGAGRVHRGARRRDPAPVQKSPSIDIEDKTFRPQPRNHASNTASCSGRPTRNGSTQPSIKLMPCRDKRSRTRVNERTNAACRDKPAMIPCLPFT